MSQQLGPVCRLLRSIFSMNVFSDEDTGRGFLVSRVRSLSLTIHSVFFSIVSILDALEGKGREDISRLWENKVWVWS